MKLMKLVTVGPHADNGLKKHLVELTYCTDIPAQYIASDTPGLEWITEIGQIRNADPDLSIIGGDWILNRSEILNNIPGKKGILFCSPLAQAEFSGEASNLATYLNWLNEGRIDHLFFGSEPIINILSQSNALHLPAPFVSEINKYQEKVFPNNNSVAILNDKAIHKNILNSLAGVSLSDAEELVINGVPDSYSALIKYFRLDDKTRDVGFLSKHEYYNIIDESKLLINLSHSEGFCYGTLEALYRGTPVLISTAMPWFKHKNLTVNNTANPQEIALKINSILNLSEQEYCELSKDCRAIADRAINRNNATARKTLREILK